LQEDVIFAAIAKQRQIEDIAASSSAKARRSAARRPIKQDQKESGHVTAIDLAKSVHSDDDTEFWD
jgi:putative transposase